MDYGEVSSGTISTLDHWEDKGEVVNDGKITGKENLEDGSQVGRTNEVGNEDNKSVGSESFTTATSSLSLKLCKICHCGEEVRLNDGGT